MIFYVVEWLLLLLPPEGPPETLWERARRLGTFALPITVGAAVLWGVS